MDLFRLMNQAHVQDELVIAEITDITEQLVNIYKTTDRLADRQYIFSKLKEILRVSAEQKLDHIHKVALQAMVELTKA